MLAEELPSTGGKQISENVYKVSFSVSEEKEKRRFNKEE